MKLLAIISMSLLLFGCSDRYRYYCQNPEFWEDAKCQKPQCEMLGDCAEDHIRPIFERSLPDDVSEFIKQGDCK